MNKVSENTDEMTFLKCTRNRTGNRAFYKKMK